MMDKNHRGGSSYDKQNLKTGNKSKQSPEFYLYFEGYPKEVQSALSKRQMQHIMKPCGKNEWTIYPHPNQPGQKLALYRWIAVNCGYQLHQQDDVYRLRIKSSKDMKRHTEQSSSQTASHFDKDK